MKYTAKILKSDRHDFMIYMKSLSFYVKEALKKAGIDFDESDKRQEKSLIGILGECFVVMRDNTPLLKASTIKKVLNEYKNEGALNILDGLFFVVTPEIFRAVTDALAAEDKGSFNEFARKLDDLYGGTLAFFADDGGIDLISKKESLIVNTCADLDCAARAIKKKINKKHMESGVLLADSKNIYIGPLVKIGKGSLILPGTCLEGETSVGRNCLIGPNSWLVDMTVGDETSVSNSVASASEIGDNVNVGPFAYIRPGCKIGNHVKIGDFVEVKNSNIGEHSKASHLTYIGDADLGEHVNMGCGTITANYDGKNKSRTVIEDGAFIGSNSNLIAPLTVKKNSFVAAGSTVTGDVPENSLAIARARQVNKPDWNNKG